jgi:hypothetical protein
MINKNCTYCGIEYCIPPGRKETAKYCSRQCHVAYLKANARKPEASRIEKRCTECGEIKALAEFSKNKRHYDGLNYRCRSCARIAFTKWLNENKFIVKHRTLQDKAKRSEVALRWQRENPERVRAIRKRVYEKVKNNTDFMLNARMRGAIWRSLKKRGAKKSQRWEFMVGYTVKQLQTHLEKQFTPEMTWENHGTYWHIDHKIPIAAFNFTSSADIDFQKCWSLNNLRPLEKIHNIKKGAKVERPFQPSLILPWCADGTK